MVPSGHHTQHHGSTDVPDHHRYPGRGIDTNNKQTHPCEDKVFTECGQKKNAQDWRLCHLRICKNSGRNTEQPLPPMRQRPFQGSPSRTPGATIKTQLPHHNRRTRYHIITTTAPIPHQPISTDQKLSKSNDTEISNGRRNKTIYRHSYWTQKKRHYASMQIHYSLQ